MNFSHVCAIDIFHCFSKGGDLIEKPRSDDFTEIPIIDTWFRTEKAMVMYLSNGTLQVRMKFWLINMSHEIHNMQFLTVCV